MNCSRVLECYVGVQCLNYVNEIFFGDICIVQSEDGASDFLHKYALSEINAITYATGH